MVVTFEGKIERRVLDQDTAAENLLSSINVASDARERCIRAREGQQIGMIHAAAA